MAVAANADLYADPRQNIFFSGVVPSLDGQCVSLVKWFLQEMTSVPNPQAARGDARYVGKTLVAQGHAVEVPYDQRRRGDVICYEYGLYGHTGVVLSDNRTFEENVNWPGVDSKIVDGSRVYASRIGSLSEGWRHDQHIYRINSYSEQGDNMQPIAPNELDDMMGLMWGNRKFNGMTDQDYANHHANWDGKPFHDAYMATYTDPRTFQYADKCFKALSNTGTATPEERAFLDTMYKVVTKKG